LSLQPLRAPVGALKRYCALVTMRSGDPYTISGRNQYLRRTPAAPGDG
jgi:hypothetical protein